MKDNLKKIRKKDLENKFGLMAIHILVNLNNIKEMVLENIFTAIDIMKGNSNKIKEKVMDHSLIMMVKYIKANGIKIKNTEKAN